MGLDRLIRREKPSNLFTATVLQVDDRHRRALCRSRNSLEVWASYLPSDFESLEEGEPVVVGITAGNAFLVRRLSSALPAETTILEV